ncbi:MAG: prepilin peptidase [Limisphaerales bacterium]|jgi:leader peptidase (prepilin peptidase)/N-methyltransferase
MEIIKEGIIEPIRSVSFFYWATVFFAFGCIVGSFLNVCIYRLPRGESIVNPPSHCPVCNWQIPWYYNIPLVSYIWLGGKCYNCGSKISPRYIIVEFITGVFFLLSWLKYGERNFYIAIVSSLLIAALIVASFIDIEHYIIPDEITYGGIICGVLISFFLPPLHNVSTHLDSLKRSITGVVVGAGLIFMIVNLGKLIFGRYRIKINPNSKVIFTEESLVLPHQEIPYGEIFSRKSDTIRFVAKRLELPDRCYWQVEVKLSPEKLIIGKEEYEPESVVFMEATIDELILPREAMGFGDVKFMAAIGAFTGWKGVLFSLCLSSIIGAVFGAALMLAGLKERSSRIPYGPFISLATIIWLLYGEEVLKIWFY